MLQPVFSVSLFTLAISVAHASEALHTPRLGSLDNFRDIAGTTDHYATRHHGTLRAGVFYRSNALTPNAADLAILNTLGIRDVYDLRTPGEIATTPDITPEGALYTNLDIIGNSSSGSTITNISFSSAQQARTMMQQTNRAFVNDAGMRGQFAVLFNQLAAADGAALFHCTAGKDRTGWTAAVLLSLAGVDEANIMSNYLATNDYTAARVAATLAAMPSSMAAIYAPLLGVDASYLQAGLDEVRAQYGSMDNYLKQGLGLSQETLYVLRGKMVRYGSLPGEPGLQGNAAAGARLLRELQDTPLSGTYSAYNHFLQSAVDAGTLQGVESTVGGQIHADAASYLMRQFTSIERAAWPFADGSDLKVGQTRLWSTALNDYLAIDASARTARSSEHSQGAMIGMTWRVSDQLAGHGSFGFNRGSVGSAGGEASTDLTFLSLGARLALESLEHGLFIDANTSGGGLDFSSKRELGAGLGEAAGDSHGTLTGASLALGYRLPTQVVVLEPSLGVRVSHLDLNGFSEKGSELALRMEDVNATRRSAMANLKATFAPIPLGGWQVSPGVQVGYEHALSAQQVQSRGRLLGLEVAQRAALERRDQFAGGVSLMANLGALSLGMDVAATGGGGSHGASGSLKASYAF